MRPRLLLLCAAALVVAQFAPKIADRLVELWWELGLDWCASGYPNVEVTTFPCPYIRHWPSFGPGIALVVVLIAFLAVCRPALWWCLRPLRELTPLIEKIGPQNLGYRMRPGPGRDELARVSRALDAMMDRVAAGYEAQRRFAADASHELRTPLAVQRVLVEVGLATARTPEQLALLAGQLLDANERNERLIEGLLVLAETDRGLISRTPVRLDIIAEQVIDDHRARAADAGLVITSTLSPRLVSGEQVLLERMIANLLQNAVKYNRPGGTIDVQVTGDPALTVANTGDDIPPATVDSLFEPFRRRSGSRLDHGGGAGLGLTIARSIARAHDGTITAAPNGNDGLRVRVTLPGES
ncbi:sensor histidine kinase [Actinoplanes sp. NPDC049265]|uniref:sensor histidine kinase n=1 Tax=Actinoplanes sp. NPDC049265 TaxID=3363902 RepID=UPI00371621D9